MALRGSYIHISERRRVAASSSQILQLYAHKRGGDVASPPLYFGRGEGLEEKRLVEGGGRKYKIVVGGSELSRRCMGSHRGGGSYALAWW